ncbi:response regulator transcription factor [Paenibacillus cisolokensis]|jgi:Response regulators consisting of a CheY-like receiver domain and a winged-helix DNA-binding domain|uniref:DNA-binding response regulator n=1 Tax=Paenibacillus cisolokensis TaxID=1658519 RepID=A0ABQ4N6H2_9BACL|nr:response regulator transcription factor [Paenibacillus cisolokensis]GIQ63526.1 DNA-binding response regulator [Paenibacillus cisolokensis]
MNDASILLVDDEQSIVHMLTTVLRKEGFANVDSAATGEAALAACERKRYDLIVLDVMLPGQSGIELCPFIRRTTDAPILFLSARSSDFDKLSGFAVGGDDYITKPFNPLEVAARIKAQLRRSFKPASDATAKTAEIYDYGRFQVHADAGELIVEGRTVPCPSLVFQLLLFLCRNPNRIFTKSELYEKVWGEQAISDDNTVMVHIHRIRERIEPEPGKPEYLVNVRGLGYKLVGRSGKR